MVLRIDDDLINFINCNKIPQSIWDKRMNRLLWKDLLT